MQTSYPGSCFCGAVRYRLISAPMFVHCCHCTDCQKQTGGAFAINAIVERDRVELLSGAPVASEMKTDSGRPHDIYRCLECQTALWSDYGRRGTMVFVRVSTLDDAHKIAPDVHIFTRSKVPWVRIPGEAPSGEVDTGSPQDGATTKKPARAFEVYYDMKKEWPAESLARREALLGPGK